MKALKWIVILLLIVAVVAGAYLLMPRKTPTPSGASLLPADTFLFLQMPNPRQARQEFKTTALYRIWMEKEVQDFLGKSISLARSNYQQRVGDNIYASLSRRAMSLAEGEAFIAVPTFENLRSVPPVVIGVDVKDRRGEADRWLAEAKAELKKSKPDCSEETKDHNGLRYTVLTAGNHAVCQAWFGSLLVVTSREDTLQAMMDQLHDAAGKSLATDERYQNARNRMPTGHAALMYVNPQPLTGMLKGFAMFMPQLQGGLKNMEAMRAIAYTTTMTNGSFQDVIFVDAPADKRGDLGSESKPVTNKMLPLTSETSLFYMVQNVDFAKAWDTLYQQLQNAPSGQLQSALLALEKFNRASGVNMPKDLLNTIGPEYAFAMKWDDGAPLPEMFAAFQVRDKAKATAALDTMWNLARVVATNEISPEALRSMFVEVPHGKEMIHALQLPPTPVPLPKVSPSYAITDQFFFLSPNTSTVRGLIDRQTTPGKSLADNPAYQRTMQALPTGGASYTYLDTRKLFERVWSLVAPLARQYAGAAPAVDGFLDINKIPQAATIGQHLQPSAAAQVVDKDGFTTVMISPVGMPAVVAGGLVGAGVAISQHFPNFPMR